jgi:mRNA-degrading endonuclease RelE of RelBE toxin-antitoxin system
MKKRVGNEGAGQRVPSDALLDFTNYRPEWNTAVAAAGLGIWDPRKRIRTGVRIHDCRCSGAIDAVDAGIEGDIVKKIGGWKTDEMLSRYNVLTDKRVKAAMEKLSEHTRDKLKKAQEKQQQEQKINVLGLLNPRLRLRIKTDRMFRMWRGSAIG